MVTKNRRETGVSKPIVLLLGTHRSGTSLLSAGLQALGVDMGADADSVGSDNVKGFWEDRRFVDINEAVLDLFGEAWLSLGAPPTEALRGPETADLRQRARVLVEEREATASAWGFKDPRTARLLPFWKAVMGDVWDRVRIVVIVRRPAASAASLDRREAAGFELGLQLWARSMRDILSLSEGQPTVFTDYDLFLSSPVSEMMRLRDRLGLADTDKDSIREFATDFPDPCLRHHDGQDLREPTALSDVYAELLEAARDQPLARQRILGLLETYLDDSDAVLRSADGLGRAVVARGQQSRSLSTQKDHAQSELDRVRKQAKSEAEALRRKVAEVELDRDRIQAKLYEQNHELESLDRNCQRLERELALRQNRIQEISEELDAALARVRDRNRQIEYLNVVLNRERFTVSRPIARRVLRSMFWLTDMLPESMAGSIRGLARRKLPGELKNRVARNHQSYEQVAARTKSARVGKNTTQFQARQGEILADLPEHGDKADLFIFPIIDWHFRIQRPQHIARELANLGHRVFYVSPRFMGEDEPRRFVVDRELQPGVFEVKLGNISSARRIYNAPPDEDLQASIAAAIRALHRHLGSHRVVAILQHPFWTRCVNRIPYIEKLYDCMDFHEGFSTGSDEMSSLERELVRTADALVVSSENLRIHLEPIRPPILIRNAAEVDQFMAIPMPDTESSRRPTIGYYGAIAEWFNFEWITAAAEQRPNVDFELVGAVTDPQFAQIEGRPNLHFRGEIPYPELPEIIRHFDVCIIPFRDNELTQHTDPVKVYEYMAAGRPVVSTRLPELERISELVWLVDDSESFIAALDSALENSRNPESEARRRSWASAESWHERAGRFSALLETSWPSISVVILSYENEALTRNCLRSVLDRSHYPGLEIIVVDNGSTDGSRAYLEAVQTEEPAVRAILSDENLGFSGGNNLGLRAATGEIVILLNNDTVVTDGWVHGLVRHFRSDAELGLVGPVTNNIGNEARIEVNFKSDEEMQAIAASRASEYAGQRFYTKSIAFFCVALRREILDSVGLLDEGFSIGFFEDDDYCRRVEEMGYGIAIADDVFIHHELSASFGRFEDEERKRIFEKNRAYYESKWGEWQPHRYREQG